MRRLTRRQQLSAVDAGGAGAAVHQPGLRRRLAGRARGGTTGALGSLYRGTDSVLGPVRRFVQGVPDVGRQPAARLPSCSSGTPAAAAAGGGRRPTPRPPASCPRCSCRPIPSEWQVHAGPGDRHRPGRRLPVDGHAGRRQPRARAARADASPTGSAWSAGWSRCTPTTSVVLLAADPTSGVGRARRPVRAAAAGHRRAAAAGLTASPLDDRPDVRVGDRLVTGPAGKTTYAAGAGRRAW